MPHRMLETDGRSLTKIIATVGPASSSAETIGKLIEAGIAIFRLNFSHGSLDDHERNVRTIRTVARKLGTNTAILGDLQGPKIRVGKVPEPGIDVKPGHTVMFARGTDEATPGDGHTPHRFTSTYERLIDDVEPGQRLLINDGAVRLLVTDIIGDKLACSVTHGGRVTSNKGINLPDTIVSVDCPTKQDWEHVAWAINHEVDFLALSFVRTADDINTLRKGIDRIRKEKNKENLRMPIVAKIELPRAVEHAASIVDASDVIMIARGDLGVEMDLARVPIIQRQLQRITDDYGKPCIVATQMLETMIKSPTPTRAEASDVANAILDGADVVMLSGETAIGEYPVLAVETMRRIAAFTEQHLADQPRSTSAPSKLIESRYRTAALAHGVWTIAQDIRAKFIIVWSQQGGGARYLSQNNFQVPIFAVTSDERAARRMQILRAVTPVVMERPSHIADFTMRMDDFLREHGFAAWGDLGVIVAGEPIGVEGVTNSLMIHAVGEAVMHPER